MVIGFFNNHTRIEMNFAEQLREKNPNSVTSKVEKVTQQQMFYEKVLSEYDKLIVKVINTLSESKGEN